MICRSVRRLEGGSDLAGPGTLGQIEIRSTGNSLIVAGDDLIRLLGLHVESPAIESLRRELNPSAEVEQDEDARFLSFPEQGMEMLFKQDGVLESIFLFAEGEGGARQFGGELPEGLRFPMSRESVRKNLGAPQETGGGEISLQQEILPWDKFHRDGWNLHIRYSKPLLSIRRVTLGLNRG